LVVAVAVFICAVVMITNKRSYGVMYNVNTLFSGMWCVCLAVASLGLYGLNPPDTYIYAMGFIAVILFNIFPSVKKNKQNIDFQVSEFSGIYRHQILYMLHIVAYIFALPLVKTSMEYIMEFGYDQIRGAEQEALGQSSLVAHAMQWLCLPLFNVTMICAAIGLATKRKNMLPTIILAIADAAVYAIIYGGRYIVVKLIFFIVSSFVISEKGRIKYLFKNHKKVIIFAMLGILLLNYLTSLRSVSGMGFIGNLVVYFAGSFSFLSELLSRNVHGSYMGFGRITFGFILNFISVIGTFVFGMPYKGTDALVTSFVGDYLTIGDSITYNALPSVLYYFILDFGKIFWVFGIIIFSAFAHRMEDNFYKKKDWNSFCKYLYILFTLFDSVLKYGYVGIGTLVSFLLIELFTSDKCKIEKIGW